MKVGLIPVNIGVESVESMVGLAQLAEGLGFESIWTFEHVVVPVGYTSEYPYSPSGKMPGPENSPIPDPILSLTFAHLFVSHSRSIKSARLRESRMPS